ncbi:hypothetical protein [Flavobacterium branchiicola]|uniref:BioF2-like acetyltransferase domain-containing protein n=1 Tax=Flavobacterium branchiicola TaxID=1114875 RepID=A0ABV9PHH0_9FLAO|nr:hypothetical protein [Flavobacterium branchiicola]MBS7255449.1 hypothetical protein [Flavobacterium branchiicola]
MEIIEVDSVYYDNVLLKKYHTFNSGDFNRLNEDKCEKVFYLIFKDTKIRLGIILGLRDGILLSPFSAPFGGFQLANDDIGLNQIDSAVKVLEEWSRANDFKGIKIVLPPLFYNNNFITKQQSSLFRANFEQINLDVNYQFSTDKVVEDYMSKIWYNAKKNLKRSLKFDLSFEKLEEKDCHIAYDIIADNRKQRGFPLRMSWELVQKTTSVIQGDFFLVKKEDIAIASAIVFHVSEGIVQVIYWGDLPLYSECKTMNFLSHEIFKYYESVGINIVDIGPSTENSIPNHGLCEFKESIGCDLSLKATFLKKIQ